MSEEKSAAQALQAYREARSVLSPLLSGLELLALLQGAFASGMLAIVREPSSPAQIAAGLHIDEERAIEFCNVFDAHGVFVKENGRYRLADKWITLTTPDSVYPFQSVLDGAYARAKALQVAAKGDTDFWTLTSDERLALAKGSSIDPASPVSPALVESLFRENVAELHAILMAGCRCLELGCGTGGGLLSRLRAYPNTTAVGVEIAADLVQEAQRRAAALGISDRVVFWQGDARDFGERDAFDHVFWSQFFFPPVTRPAVLRVAWHALKPDGILMAPIQGDSSIIKEHLHTEAGQAYTRSRVLFGSWGIPAQSADDLQRELEEVGFENIRPTAVLNPVIVARRPFRAKA